MTTPRPLLLTASTTVLACAAASLLSVTAPAQAQSAQAATSAADHGKYLVDTSGCHDCHTPFKLGPKGPEPDRARMLSGHPQELKMPPVPVLPPGLWLTVSAATNTAYAGPWGVSFSAYLKSVPAIRSQVPEPWAPGARTAAN